MKSANLCWGQRYIWLRHHQLPPEARHETHIVLKFKLPDGLPVARIRSVLSYLVRRHESLRTTFHLDGGLDPQQRVNPPAALPVLVVTTERDGTPTPAEVMDRLVVTEFDLAGEWPIRACVITTGGAARQLVLVLNHLAFDAWSVDRLEREIKALGASSRPAAFEPVRHQPLDLARFEASQTGEQRERSLRYWRDEIATLPADPFGAVRRHRDGPAANGATLTSPELLATCRHLATEHRVWPSLIHLAAYTLLLAAYTRHQTVSLMALTGNRESGPFKEAMTCLFTPTLLSVGCHDDPSFTALLRRAAAQLEQARSHSQVPYDELVELVAVEGVRRGRPVGTGTELNFVSQPSRRCHARRGQFSWNPPPLDWAHSGADLSFRITEWQDAAVITFNAASSVMSAEDLQRFLRGYEAVLAAHQEPGADLRVSDVVRMIGWAPPERAERTVAAGADLVDVDEVERVLLGHPAVGSAKVWAQPGGELVAHVHAERPLTPAQLRTHFLGRMYDHHSVRCPDRFRVHHGAASVEGDGRTVEPKYEEQVPATTEAERVLVAVVRAANELDDVDLADSYPTAGGRVLRLPLVLAMLRDRGWHGIALDHLASARPLRAVAGLLTPTAGLAGAAADQTAS